MADDADLGVASTTLPPASTDPQDWSTANPSEIQYAGFARRLAAVPIDFAVVTALQLAIGMPLLMLVDRFTNASESTFDRTGTVVFVAVWWLYYALMESSASQATLGKKLLGVQVVDLYCNRIGFWRATIRTLTKFISALFCGLGFFIIDYTKYKQGMHDMMARTLVICRPASLQLTDK